MMLFPYRAHLEAEIEYLKTELARSQRRCDELQESLIRIATPQPKVQFERKSDGALRPVQPRGWDAYRAWKKDQPEEPEEAPKEAASV